MPADPRFATPATPAIPTPAAPRPAARAVPIGGGPLRPDVVFNPPPQQQPPQGPAATPAEHEARKAGWRSFLTGMGERFQTDPDFRSFMLNLGTRLMQPYSPGQTALGHLGASLQGATNYSAALAAQRQAGQTAARREDREARQSQERLDLERERVGIARAGQESRAELDRARAEAATARAAPGQSSEFAKDMNLTTFVSKYVEANALLGSAEGKTPDDIRREAENIWYDVNQGRPGVPARPEAQAPQAPDIESTYPSADYPIGTEVDDTQTGRVYINTASGWVER